MAVMFKGRALADVAATFLTSGQNFRSGPGSRQAVTAAVQYRQGCDSADSND